MCISFTFAQKERQTRKPAFLLNVKICATPGLHDHNKYLQLLNKDLYQVLREKDLK